MKVAVVVPVRDAASLLPDCLAAIHAQDRPSDAILVVVAPSSDGTHDVASSLAGAETTILDNPAGDRGSAINRALDATDADVIAMVDAQARLAPDYLSRALVALERHAACVVGGPMRPEGRTVIGRAMAAALCSPFGIGNSQFHFEGQAREVEAVYLGVYRSGVFAKVGRYNPALLRTEDDDLNARVRDAGLRIWLDPAIRSTYLCRDSLGAIWRQYHGYGYWKVALATIRPGAIRLRHLVPAFFVVGLAVAAVVSLVLWWPALPLILLMYLGVALGAALVGSTGNALARLLFPLVTLTMHMAYGTGVLRGLLHWPRVRAVVRRGAP